MTNVLVVKANNRPDGVSTKMYEAFMAEAAKVEGLNVTTFEIKDETKFFLSFVFYYCYNLEYTEYENGLYLGSKTNPYKAFIK